MVIIIAYMHKPHLMASGSLTFIVPPAALSVAEEETAAASSSDRRLSRRGMEQGRSRSTSVPSNAQKCDGDWRVCMTYPRGTGVSGCGEASSVVTHSIEVGSR